MRRLWCWVWLVSGCVPSQVFCLDDADLDGVCGAADVCPVDPLNDEDGDGICGNIDICPAGDDFADADLDTIPDACDVCPLDETNDADEDGICDKSDPCPGIFGDVCDRTYTLGLQADYFPLDATYSVTFPSGEVLVEGAFATAGEVLYTTVPVSTSEGSFCVQLSDSFGDGGVSGFVWDGTTGTLEQWWTFQDWTDQSQICTSIQGEAVSPEPPPIYDEETWPTVGSCPITVTIQTLTWANETGWNLGTGAERELISVAPGGYANDSEYTYELTAFEGPHKFQMLDSYGDGWHGGTFTVRHTGSSGEPIAQDSLDGGSSGVVNFILDCPDPVDLGGFEDTDADTGL